MNDVYAFITWMLQKTARLQNNAVVYNDKVYFIDRRSESEPDAGFEDLYKIYKNE